ncbi:MAG TPA: phospholipase A [Candidimonas sp.]|nr:phospholipase A [Candidimonas sp.]
MTCNTRIPSRRLALLIAVATVLFASSANAGMSYKLDRSNARAGETVRITGLLFNDTENALVDVAAKELVLQWRGPEGKVIRSLAYLRSAGGQVNVPVNNFVKFAWEAVVPTGVTGLQAVHIEGESALLALDTSASGSGAMAGNAALAPVVDAGTATGNMQLDPALPKKVAQAASQPSPFDNFRNAITPYEPIYFDVGNKDGRNARYQVSFKYRLFNPDDPSKPEFEDNIYLGYTQTAIWDLHSDSHPFVDTSFKPSLFWRKDALWQSKDRDVFLGLASGVEHESNGRSGNESRSLNFAYIQPEFNYRFDGGSTLTFAPRLKGYFKVDNNPDYADYAGHVDWKLRWAQDNGLVLTGLYRQGQRGMTTGQIEAAWPLRRTFLNMNGYFHVQYFRGYGETLLGYNHKSAPQVRVGISLVP